MTTTTSTGATSADPILDLVQYQKDLAAKKTTSTGSTTSTAASTKSGSSTLGKDDFMNLLVTQLRYQDPLSPQDNSQMAAQMAQFSSLESMQNVQKAVEALGTTFTDMAAKQADSATAITNSSATGMIGKSVRFKQTDVAVPATGSTTSLSIHASAGSVANILDADGNTVHSIPLDGTNEDGTNILDANGDGTIKWDGKDDTGKTVAAGSYTLSIVDQTTLKSSGYAYGDASISSVSFDTDGALLKAGTMSFRMKDLVEVHGGDSTTQSSSSSTGADTTAALAMVGKTARFRDASADLTTSDNAKWTFTATDGSIGQILDSNGTVVKSFTVSSQGNFDSSKNTGSYAWNGTEDSGDSAAAGTYYLRIVDPTATKTTGTAYIEGKIDNVAFDTQGNPRLVSGEQVWTLKDLFTLS
jgi:flagellar basal-body rod modification protein FlgD